MNIVPYIKAGYPILYLVTAEEARAEALIVSAAKEAKRNIQFWSHTEGFLKGDGTKGAQTEDPIDALSTIQQGPKQSLYVLRDLHCFFSNPRLVRLLRDIARDFKQTQKTLIILSAVRRIPPELERDVTMLDFELPARPEIAGIFQKLYTTYQDKIGEIGEDEQERIVQAALGLTTVEAENAFSKAIVEHVLQPKGRKEPISQLVLKEKALAVRKTGVLEYFQANQGAQDIGGLENLMLWLTQRSQAFSRKARDYGLPMPRGALLVGLPGCGKSLAAKVASSILGAPLIRFDIGRVFGGLVGESEANMRLAIQTAEAVGTCVLWIDEMEKAFAGVGSGASTDGGSTQRVFANFLTWMQEKNTPCFIVATVNRIEGLPAELLRKGRFDEIFFVGLPSAKERSSILQIHIEKHGRKMEVLKTNDLSQCLEASEGHSGAEISEAVVSGLYAAFHQNRELTGADILKALKETNPLSKAKAGDLEGMTKWAEANAVNASRNDPSANGKAAKGGRQLTI